MRILSFIVLAFGFVYLSCSSANYVQKEKNLKGKKVGIVPFEFIGSKKRTELFPKDSICVCLGQSISDSLIPYFKQAGVEVVSILHEGKATEADIWKKAEAMQLEYVVTGRGVVTFYGKEDVIEALNISMTNVSTKEPAMGVSFSGVSVNPKIASEKIGNTILKKLK